MLWRWLPVIICMIGIYVGASIPEPPVPADVTDVSLHEAGYLVLTLLVIRALAKQTWHGVTAATMFRGWVVAVLHGASVEWLQAYLPWRHAEVGDLIADATGACAAVIVVGAWSIIRRL